MRTCLAFLLHWRWLQHAKYDTTQWISSRMHGELRDPLPAAKAGAEAATELRLKCCFSVNIHNSIAQSAAWGSCQPVLCSCSPCPVLCSTEDYNMPSYLVVCTSDQKCAQNVATAVSPTKHEADVRPSQNQALMEGRMWRRPGINTFLGCQRL